MVVVVLINLAAAALSGAVIIHKARTATEVETAASLAVVEPLVAETLQALQDAPLPGLFRTLAYRFRACATSGSPCSMPKPSGRGRGAARGHAAGPGLVRAPDRPAGAAPRGAAELERAPASARRSSTADRRRDRRGLGLRPRARADRPRLEPRHAGDPHHRLRADPEPLAQLAAGLTRLEQQDYGARVGRPDTRELAVIAARFNRLAEALGAGGRPISGCTAAS